MKTELHAKCKSVTQAAAKRIRADMGCEKNVFHSCVACFSNVERAQAQPIPPHARKIYEVTRRMPMEKDDGASGPHLLRARLTLVLRLCNSEIEMFVGKKASGGFSYLGADSGVVSSAAVAHRARTASLSQCSGRTEGGAAERRLS